MFAEAPPSSDLSDSWIEGDPSARWRTAALHGPGTGAKASGSSVLEVDRGCRLPRHTDSAEEVAVVISGVAEIEVGGERARVGAGGVALVPKDVPHEVRNAGEGTLRFMAVYASTDVVTTYEADVQPDGGRERRPLG